MCPTYQTTFNDLMMVSQHMRNVHHKSRAQVDKMQDALRRMSFTKAVDDPEQSLAQRICWSKGSKSQDQSFSKHFLCSLWKEVLSEVACKQAFIDMQGIQKAQIPKNGQGFRRDRIHHGKYQISCRFQSPQMHEV